MSKLRIAVVMGGDSAEREISLLSGRAIFANLDREKYAPVAVALDRVPEKVAGLPEALRDGQVDIAFLALHGGGGEDGHLQALLEEIGLLYTGSGAVASAKAMNKILAKEIFRQAGIPTPRGKSFLDLKPEKASAACAQALQDPGLPLVVKPANQGSTIGISIIHEPETLLPAFQEALRYDADILAEEFISGREITATVIGNEEPEVLPLIEIVPKSGFYDFHAKYLAADTEKIVPARLSGEVATLARRFALAAYRALGCSGFARVDSITTGQQVYVLEVNTLPGMTGDHSLVPCAAQAAGISYPRLLDRILQLALERADEP